MTTHKVKREENPYIRAPTQNQIELGGMNTCFIRSDTFREIVHTTSVRFAL
jgi:hypothetical protein